MAGLWAGQAHDDLPMCLGHMPMELHGSTWLCYWLYYRTLQRIEMGPLQWRVASYSTAYIDLQLPVAGQCTWYIRRFSHVDIYILTGGASRQNVTYIREITVDVDAKLFANDGVPSGFEMQMKPLFGRRCRRAFLTHEYTFVDTDEILQ
jgi:hypothetical protein